MRGRWSRWQSLWGPALLRSIGGGGGGGFGGLGGGGFGGRDMRLVLLPHDQPPALILVEMKLRDGGGQGRLSFGASTVPICRARCRRIETRHDLRRTSFGFRLELGTVNECLVR